MLRSCVLELVHQMRSFATDSLIIVNCCFIGSATLTHFVLHGSLSIFLVLWLTATFAAVDLYKRVADHEL